MKNSFMWYLLKQLFSGVSMVLLTPVALVVLLVLSPLIALIEAHERFKRQQGGYSDD